MIAALRRTLRRLRPKTLRGRITAWMVVILLVTSAVLGVVTVLFLRSFLINGAWGVGVGLILPLLMPRRSLHSGHGLQTSRR